MIFFAEQFTEQDFTEQDKEQSYFNEMIRTRLVKALALLACIFMLSLNSSLLLADGGVVKTAIKQPASLSELEQTIRARIVAVRPDLVVDGLVATPIKGLYEATIKDGPKIYVTTDGDFFITGDMYAVKAEGIVNLAEAARQQERMASLAAINDNDMIIFSPKKTKATVTVFTDVDCGYCQKLHKEVPELNRLGVEVRYLAFPRAGVGSETYHKLVSAWCADDPKKALTTLKNRQAIENKSCDNPIAEQYALGQTMGVTGTPALVTSDGRLLPGYMPANVLAETLGITN